MLGTIGTIIVLILIVVGGSFFWMGKVKDLRVIHEVRPNAIHNPGYMFNLGEFLVNLAEPDHYIKTTVVFYLDEEKYIELARQREPVMRDVVVTVLSSKGIRDIATIEGKELLKRELREKLTAILPKGRLTDLRFTQFAIQ